MRQSAPSPLATDWHNVRLRYDDDDSAGLEEHLRALHELVVAKLKALRAAETEEEEMAACYALFQAVQALNIQYDEDGFPVHSNDVAERLVDTIVHRQGNRLVRLAHSAHSLDVRRNARAVLSALRKTGLGEVISKLDDEEEEAMHHEATAASSSSHRQFAGTTAYAALPLELGEVPAAEPRPAAATPGSARSDEEFLHMRGGVKVFGRTCFQYRRRGPRAEWLAWRCLLRKFSLLFVLLLGTPMLLPVAIVLWSSSLLSNWAESLAGDEPDIVMSLTFLTAVFLASFVVFVITATALEFLKPGRLFRIRTVIVTGCAFTVLLWGAGLMVEGSYRGTALPIVKLRGFVQGSMLLHALALVFTVSFIFAGLPGGARSGAKLHCCRVLRVNRVYMPSLGQLLYKGRPFKVMYRVGPGGTAAMLKDLEKYEKQLSKLRMQNQEKKSVRRQVRRLTRRLKKYRRAVEERQAEMAVSDYMPLASPV